MHGEDLMAGESQATPKSEPDPSVLTTQQLSTANAALAEIFEAKIDVIRQRLSGMDEATKVLHETVTRTPTDIQKAVGHLESLMGEKFDAVADISTERFQGVALQFKERDTRSERESRDNKVAVDAAFAAQKEAAAKQDEANQKAIDKSEKATNESIAKLGDVVKASNDALADKIDDIKTRISQVEAIQIGIVQRTAGSREQIVEHRSVSSAAWGAIAGVGGLILLVLTVIGFIVANKP